MINFRSWQSYHDFEQAVKGKNRYFYNLDVKDFLQTVLETGKSREEIYLDVIKAVYKIAKGAPEPGNNSESLLDDALIEICDLLAAILKEVQSQEGS